MSWKGKPKPNFQEDLKRGKAGEEKLVKHCHLKLGPCKDEKERRWDFESASGLTVEVKSDYWPLKTGNFFMEKWSDVRTKKLGGPWRAFSDDVDVFIYFYPKENTYFYFRDVEELVARLNLLTEKLEPVTIHNRNWTTEGYKIPREELAGLFHMYTWED